MKHKSNDNAFIIDGIPIDRNNSKSCFRGPCELLILDDAHIGKHSWLTVLHTHLKTGVETIIKLEAWRLSGPTSEDIEHRILYSSSTRIEKPTMSLWCDDVIVSRLDIF